MGCDHEDTAHQVYVDQMQQEHSKFDCFCGGLIISEEFPFIAATPDGISRCACCGEGVVEIKCPYCTKDSDPNSRPSEAVRLVTEAMASPVFLQ